MIVLGNRIFDISDDIIHNSQEPDMMGHFHNIVSFAVYPEINITQIPQWVVAIEPGKCHDTHF